MQPKKGANEDLILNPQEKKEKKEEK